MSQFQPEGSTALRQGPDVQPIFSTSHIVYNGSTHQEIHLGSCDLPTTDQISTQRKPTRSEVHTRHTGPALIIYMIMLDSCSGPLYGKGAHWTASLSQEKHLNENLNFNLFFAFVFSSSRRFRQNGSTGSG
jgi:hypothetical protein